MLSSRAKSRSQAANLPGARPLMRLLKNYNRGTFHVPNLMHQLTIIHFDW